MSEEKKPVVLIVEDLTPAAMAAKIILKQMGFDSEHAKTGEEAISMSEKNDYYCVLLDIGLGDGISGDEAAVQIRENEKNTGKNRLWIFALTAHVEEDAKKRYFESGIDEVFEKPLRKTLLQNAIDKHIKNDE